MNIGNESRYGWLLSNLHMYLVGNFKQLPNMFGSFICFSSVQTDTEQILLPDFLVEANTQTQGLDFFSLIFLSGHHSQSGHKLYCSSKLIIPHFEIPTSSQILS